MDDCPRCGSKLPPERADSPICTAPIPTRVDATENAVATIVPFKNPAALTAYYLGLFGSLLSCIPILGMAGLGMSIAAFVLGIKGREAARLNPHAHGTAHAWIGIIGGALGIVFGVLMQGSLLFFVVSSVMFKSGG